MNAERLKSNNKNFENFIQLVENIRSSCALYDYMTNINYNMIYKKAPDFWLTVFRSVQDNAILNLHDIFTDSKETLNVNTIFNMIDDQKIKDKLEEIIFCRNVITKRRVKNFRDSLVAHKDKSKFYKQIEEIYAENNDSNEKLGSKYHIRKYQLKVLVEDLYEIINLSKSLFGKEDTDYSKKAFELDTKIIDGFNLVTGLKI
jgi:hypothetical protein